MIVITTFNHDLYKISGKYLIRSLNKFEIPYIVYSEDDWDEPSIKRWMNLNKLPELIGVQNKYKDKLEPDTSVMVKRRWFGFYKKIVTQYDAVMRRFVKEDFIVFVDCDVIFHNKLTAKDIKEYFDTDWCHVGICKGNRSTIESSILVWQQCMASKLCLWDIIDYYLDGDVFEYEDWDDSAVLTKWLNQTWQDFAKEKQYISEMRNGRATHKNIVSQTWLSKFLVHNKEINKPLYLDKGDEPPKNAR